MARSGRFYSLLPSAVDCKIELHLSDSTPCPTSPEFALQLDFDINVRKATIKEIQELKSKLRTAIKKQHTARNVTLRDKISFVIGTTLAM